MIEPKHEWQVICDETNNGPDAVANGDIHLDIVLRGPDGWGALHDEIDAAKAKALGISPEFLRNDFPINTGVVASPAFAQAVRVARANVQKKVDRLMRRMSKPKAIRGGAKLPYSEQKFRSLREARLWWKQMPKPTIEWFKNHVG
jgi:hypothetical protein